jgi:hypothetical protein
MKKLFSVLIFCLLGSVVYAQTDVTGTWDTGKYSTHVKILEKEGVYTGEIAASANPQAIIGTQLIKDIENEKGKWKGKLFAAKIQKWVDAEFKPEESVLKITVKAGLMKKTIEWKRIVPTEE